MKSKTVTKNCHTLSWPVTINHQDTFRIFYEGHHCLKHGVITMAYDEVTYSMMDRILSNY